MIDTLARILGTLFLLLSAYVILVQWYAIIARLLTFFLDPGCALLAGSVFLYPLVRLFRCGKSSTDQPSESARQNGGDAPNE